MSRGVPGLAAGPDVRYLVSTVSDEHERPTKQDIDFFLENLRPRIEAMLREHGCSTMTARALIQEAMLPLARHAHQYQWTHVRNREPWLLDRIEKAVQGMSFPPQEARGNDEPSL
jgi:hypothetical protein